MTKIKLTKVEKAIVRLHVAGVADVRHTALMFSKYFVKNQDREDFKTYMEEHHPDVIQHIEDTVVKMMGDGMKDGMEALIQRLFPK